MRSKQKGRPGAKKEKALGFVLGGALGLSYCAVSLGRFGAWLLALPPGAYALCLAGGFAVCILPGLLVQTVLHEGGHLTGGLASGYGFRSFRVGSFIWYAQEGRVRLGRMKLPGTAGQCLLAPPAPAADGSYPYRRYLAGGVLANGVTGLLCLWPALTCRSYWLAMFCLGQALMGLWMALQNGLPLRTDRIATDGYHFFRMGKNAAVRRAVWLQLAYAATMAEGRRLAELPEAWFAPGRWVLEQPEAAGPARQPGPDEALAVFCGMLQISRLQEAGEWARADAAARAMLAAPAGPDGLLGLQRDSLELELTYSALVGPERQQWLAGLGEKGAGARLQQARNNAALPAGLRVLYAWYLLARPEPRRAAAWRQRYLAALAAYPYPAEAECERKQLARADAAAAR